MTFFWKSFSTCMPKHPQNSYPRYPYIALQLSLVCSHWHALSLCSCRLWTNIALLHSTKVPRDGEPGPSDRAHHEMIHEETMNIYVHRSRWQLISIFVCKSTKPPPSKGPPPPPPPPD
ncbi:uncharacterized protein BT62DRAFT_1081230 [Guyanagaster necrorhizus]|uniref:Uncharacterized protein n=1 Tax=Guyanagaster necrorhizus TaxID=856835 RepID=A0A9P7VG79_9AGAR|nr:uncharacterized protein BT62DRAFT_1081230 [Guyanagaster necrorhizus MCA 3950]KAG7439975.1 hypothetical protein BT62DRAFT_1081230 [Guyanagaster necrorhizus MCA 3950]